MTELSLLRYIQSFSSPLLDSLFIAITTLGSEEFFIIVVATLYWCVDKRSGLAMAMIVAGTSWANAILKGVFQVPRPTSEHVRVVYPEPGTSFAFPSGHTQGATVFWGALPRYFRHRGLAFIALAVIPLVDLSRLYLGVHWPSDVLGGLGFGLTTLLMLPYLAGACERLSCSSGAPLKALSAVVVPLLVLLAVPTIDTAKMSGMVTGLGTGIVAEGHLLGFGVGAPRRSQILKCLLGTTLVFSVRLGLKAVFPETLTATYARYVAVGVTGALFVPLLFVATGLARPAERRPL